MSIVWLRHGETALNASRVMQPADTPLSPIGLAQAAAVARRLAAWRPSAILSSDLPRARQTADALAALTGLAVDTDPVLQERNFGTWRGRPLDGLGVDPSTHADAPPGGESLADFLARADRAWRLVTARRAGIDGPLVVVSHGLLIQAVLRRHGRWPPGAVAPSHLGNTAVSVVDPWPDAHVGLAGCTLHLGGPDAAAPPSPTGAPC